jgi:hypothetical protein
MVGLALKTAAGFFQHESFSPWDADTDTFGPSFIGRLQRVDRFRTIYHRPTRRQQLAFQADVTLPTSGIVRHDPTGEVFLLSGTLETEWHKGDQLYERLVALHRASPPSGGLGSYQPTQVLGAGDDLGVVVLGASQPVYYDTELRTVSNEQGLEEATTGEELGVYSKNITPESGDFFLLGGEYYRITYPYIDGGFSLTRMVKEDPSFVTLIYDYGTATDGGYDPATGTVIPPTSATRLVSAIPGKREMARDRESQDYTKTAELFIYQRHVGFEPKVDDTFTLDSQLYKILSVGEDTQEKQWIIEAGL